MSFILLEDYDFKIMFKVQCEKFGLMDDFHVGKILPPAHQNYVNLVLLPATLVFCVQNNSSVFKYRSRAEHLKNIFHFHSLGTLNIALFT